MLSIPSVSGSIPFESQKLWGNYSGVPSALSIVPLSHKMQWMFSQPAPPPVIHTPLLEVSNRLTGTPGSMNPEFPCTSLLLQFRCPVTSLLFHGLLLLQTVCRNLICLFQLQALLQWVNLVLKGNIMKHHWDSKLLWLFKKTLVPHVF